MSTQPFFINVHIPKCGGTTFRTVLYRNFRGRCEEVYNLLWEDPYTADQLAFFIGDSPGYDCMSSHRLSLDLPFDRTNRDIIALCFVRDPAERLFSHYFYERNRSYQRECYAYLRDMTPAQFIDHVLAESSEQYLFDYQYRHLTRGVADPSPDKVHDLVDRNRLVLLPLERFDEALLVLGAMFPTHFKDVRYVRQNVSAKDHAIDDTLRQRVLPRMEIDSGLHTRANAWLDSQIEQHWTDQRAFDADLARHRKRCRRYELFAVRPTSWAKTAFGRLSRLLGA